MAPDDDTPCEACGLDLLDGCLRTTRAGELIRAALDIDFTKTAGITIGADDVSCLEFSALKMIAGERERYNAEQAEQARRDAEAAARQQRNKPNG